MAKKQLADTQNPETCETVRVKSSVHEQGFKVINAEDFDEEEHELFGAEGQVAVVAKAPADMDVDELRAHLSGLGIEVPPGSKKPAMLRLVPTE